MTVTLLYTSLLALWFVILSARVIGYRGTASISLGDGDDETKWWQAQRIDPVTLAELLWKRVRCGKARPDLETGRVVR